VNTGDTVIVQDNGIGDSNSASNVIQYNNSSFGNFDVGITAKTNSPGGNIPGVGPAGRLQDITITTRDTTGVADSLVLDVSSGGFSIYQVGQAVTLSNSLSTSDLDVGGTGVFWSALNGTQTANAVLDNTSGTGPMLSGSSVTTKDVLVGAVPVTLTNELIISLTGIDASAQLTGTTLAPVPAPPGIVLALAGLPVLGFGWLRWKRT